MHVNKPVLRLLAGALLASAAIGTGPAQAATLFDSQALAAAAGLPAFDQTDMVFHGGLTAVLGASADTPINQIGMFVSVPTGQDVKFVIFKSGLGSSAATLLYSQTKHFAATSAMQYIYSDPFAFTLQSGVMYDIGLIGSGPDIVFRLAVRASLTQGALTNGWGGHLAYFNAPVSGTYVPFNAFVQLNTVPAPAAPAVPEPASWALMIGGLGAVGGALRRKRTRVAFA